MTRRDTIIIAVLVNVGIIIVLFTSALKNSKDAPELANEVYPPSQIEIPAKKEMAAASGDEVDHMLKQYAQNSQSAASALAPAAQTEAKPNFAADLNAIAFGDAENLAQPAAPSPAKQQEAVAAADIPKAPEAVKSEFIEVRVKKGDVLEKIARANHTSVEEIMRVNRLASSRLRIGQVLKVPNKGNSPAQPASLKTPNQNPEYYVVKNGDSPWKIAHKNHVKLEDLLKLNNMDEEKARRLKAGDKIRIR